jgi:hypothetical protein
MPTPVTRRDADEFHFLWEAAHVEIVVTEIREDRGRMYGTVYGYSTLGERPGLLDWSYFPLDSMRERGSFARGLGRRWEAIKPEAWEDMVLYACKEAVHGYRGDVKGIRLSDVPPRIGHRMLVPGLLPFGETSSLFADGGSGKSTLGAALCIAVAAGIAVAGFRPSLQGPVMYGDWETTDEEMADRARAICAGLDLDTIPSDFHYYGLTRPLAEVGNQLHAEAARLDAALFVSDSIIAGLDTPAKDDDGAKRYMNALRGFGPQTTRLAVTHITKEAAESDHATAFGSAFFRNYSRAQWEMRLTREEGGTVETILVQRKRNRGPAQKPIALRFDWAEDESRVALERIEPGVTSLRYLDPMERIRTAILRAPQAKLDSEQLKNITGLTAAELRAYIARMGDEVIRLNPDERGRGKIAVYALNADWEIKRNALRFPVPSVALSPERNGQAGPRTSLPYKDDAPDLDEVAF